MVAQGPSAWRPAKAPSAEHVQVQVKVALPGVRSDVPHQPIAAVGDTLLACHLIGRVNERLQDRAVLGPGRVDAPNVGPRDHEQVHWSLRTEIAERHHLLVAVYLRTWVRAVRDATERTACALVFAHAGPALLQSVADLT